MKVKFESKSGTVAGDYKRASEGKVILLLHGSTSNKDRPRLIAWSSALNDAGYSTLRIDFAGSGESDDGDITLENQVNNMHAAISWLEDKNHGLIGVFGESLGGLVALQGYSSKINAYVLLAPVTYGKTPTIFKDEKKAEEIQRTGKFSFEKDGRTFYMPIQYMEERQAVDQDELAASIKIPALLIQGDQDRVIDINETKKMVTKLPKSSRLVIIPGADHMFHNHYAQATPHIVEWFSEHL